MHTKPELLTLLRDHGLRLRKRLSQHYLVDPHVVERLIASCHLDPRTDRVIEIGAGLGALTIPLARAAHRVLAFEVDRAISQILKERVKGLSNVEVRCADILTVSWKRYRGRKVVGAIPYHITAPILVGLCEASGAIEEAWFAMQREVADRLSARPGTKAYGRLSVLVQHRFDVFPGSRIPRGAFFPSPKVESRWIHVKARRGAAGSTGEESLFFDVVKAAFSQRRKTLVNCLQEMSHPRLDREHALEVVRQARLPERIRGEELSIQAFRELARTVGALANRT